VTRADAVARCGFSQSQAQLCELVSISSHRVGLETVISSDGYESFIHPLTGSTIPFCYICTPTYHKSEVPHVQQQLFGVREGDLIKVNQDNLSITCDPEAHDRYYRALRGER